MREKPQLRKQSRSKASGSLRLGGISSHSWAVISSFLWCDTTNPVFNSFKPLFFGLWCWQQNPISGWHLFSFTLWGWCSIVPGTCYHGERSAVGQIVLSSCLVIWKISLWSFLFRNVSVSGFIFIYFARCVESFSINDSCLYSILERFQQLALQILTFCHSSPFSLSLELDEC